MRSLFEKYRPATLDDVIGQPRAVAAIRALEPRGLPGRAYWLSGASGTGKTTLARIIARMSGADEWCTAELDAADLTPAKLRDVERVMGLYGFGAGGRAWLINETHRLRVDAIDQLLILLERLPGHVVVVFTTTGAGQTELFVDHVHAEALLSRCIVLPLTNQGLAEPFARRAQEIAAAEGLDGRPLAAYLRLVKDHHNNLRAVLQQIDQGAMRPNP